MPARTCRNCSAPVVVHRGRTWDVTGVGGPHWCTPVVEPLPDLIECLCGAVVWRDHQRTKTDTATEDVHVCLPATVVEERQAVGGATPPPRPAVTPSKRPSVRPVDLAS